jgi:uncharacterized membrane protein YeaQ/YmgE (transglycosylase-associated protein family)
VAVISMIVVGISAGQLFWALLPAAKSTGWPAVLGLGVLGSLVGGYLMSKLLHGTQGATAEFHPMGLIGSIVGTAVLVALAQLPRRGRL